VTTPRLLVASVEPVSFVDGPGARLTVFLQGCNLDCVNCHNPSLIDAQGQAAWWEIDELLDLLRPRAGFLRGVTLSGGEATGQLDGVVALFTAIGEDPALAHLTRLVDTNGTLHPAGWQRLVPVMEGAMIDLKAIDDDTHRRLTGSGNAEVLRSIRLVHALGRLHELRLLVIEGITDQPDELTRYARFVAELDPAIPLRVLAFRHHGTRTKARHWPETSEASVARVVDALRAHGLREVRAPA